ncbi:Secreted protein [Pseudomonas chlororaphis]
MLTHWIFVVFIGGQPVVAEQKTSEADCNRTLVRVVTLARTQGKDAIGARYLRATSS